MLSFVLKKWNLRLKGYKAENEANKMKIVALMQEKRRKATIEESERTSESPVPFIFEKVRFVKIILRQSCNEKFRIFKVVSTREETKCAYFKNPFKKVSTMYLLFLFHIYQPK